MRSIRTSSSRPSCPSFAPRPIALADTFINCLVQAGLCEKHSPWRPRSSKIQRSSFFTKVLHYQAGTAVKEAGDSQLDWTNDQPPSPGIERHQSTHKNLRLQQRKNPMATVDPARQAQSDRTTPNSSQFPELPSDFGMDFEQSRNLYNFYVSILGYEEGTKAIRLLLSNPQRELCAPRAQTKPQAKIGGVETRSVLVLLSLLGDGESSDRQVFEAYKVIPAPRMPYLNERSRGILLHRFAKPDRHRHDSTLRYLTLIDDMCSASLYISPSLWTTAIHLAGKSGNVVNGSNFSSAIGLWRRMEHEGNIPSSSATFNVLFDIAIKAGKFQVAERIIKEMDRRKVDFTRCGRVARIFSFGLQRDVQKVRQAYDDFVRSGEIVDTVVLNCVMVSLVRAGHPEIAEEMYERMKGVHQQAIKDCSQDPLSTLHPRLSDNHKNYRKASKTLGRILGMSAYLHDKLPEHHRAIQAAMSLTPDAKTFHILLSYHAYISGDLERFMSLIRDMENILVSPPWGMVYMFLFHGFALHGGKRSSQWTYIRLRRASSHFFRLYHESQREVARDPLTIERVTKFFWHGPKGDEGSANILNNDYSSPHQSPSYKPQTGGIERRKNRKHIPLSKHDNVEDDEEEDDTWRDDRGVYLGRKMIVSCLRAFSTCGGPKAVEDIWGQIEPLWGRESLKRSDIISVMDTLDELAPSRRH